MTEILSILIPYTHAAPTNADVREAKQWTLRRNDNAAQLSALIQAMIEDAAEKLTAVAYRYNISLERFQFSADKGLYKEASAIIDNLEDSIMNLIVEYALREAENEEQRHSVLPWMLALHSKGAETLRGTLRMRLTQFLRDTEAQIAAMRMAGYAQGKAVTRIISTMHSVYAAPEMQRAFRTQAAALYLRSRGIHHGNRGLSSSGAVNVENFAATTAIQAWERIRLLTFKKRHIDAFYVARGSRYPCEAICDQFVGFHLITEEEAFPPFHGHCCCIAIPIKRIL